MRRIREENTLLLAAVNEYKVRIRNLEKANEKELNKMALLQKIEGQREM